MRDSRILFCNNVFNAVGYDGAAGALELPAVAGHPEDIATGVGVTAPRTFGIEFEYRIR